MSLVLGILSSLWSFGPTGILFSLWSFGPTAMWLDRLPQGDAQ